MTLVDKFYWNDTLDNKLINIYGTMLINDVAKQIGTTISSIRYRAHKLQLKRNKRKYKFDDSKFDTLTPENCYWAGFIAADGCVQERDKRLDIMLSNVDKNHLYKFQNFMNSNVPVHYTNRREVYIRFNGAYNTIRSLCNYFNITPRKSKTLQPPLLQNELHIKNFIRGVLDGDGCICRRKDYNTWTISFCGTKKLLEWISFQLSYYVGVNMNIPCNTTGMNIVGWQGPQNKYIIEWLYNDSTSDTRLDRKYLLSNLLIEEYITKNPHQKSSKYRGISYYKRENKWVAAIKINNHKKVIGYFDTEREAAIAYNLKARELGLLERCYDVN